MGSRTGAIIAGVSGLIWIAFVALAEPLTNELALPTWEADRAAITEYYSAASFDGPFITGIALAILLWLPLLTFVAKLADILGSADGGSRWVGYLILAGQILSAAIVTAYFGVFAAGVFWGSHGGLSEDGYLALHGIASAFLLVPALTAIIWVVPAGVAIIATGRFPRVLGWLMLVVAVALLLSVFAGAGVAGYVASLPPVMIAVLALWMLLHLDRYSESTAEGLPEGTSPALT